MKNKISKLTLVSMTFSLLAAIPTSFALTADEILDNNIYHSELGFSAIFPTEWDNYIVTVDNLDFEEYGTAQAVQLGLPGETDTITISRHATQDWIDLSQYQGEKPELLGVSDGYALGYTTNPETFDETAQWVLDHITLHKEPLSDIEGTLNEQAIQYLIDTGVVSGYMDGTFKPGNSINRAELMKILTEAHGPTPDPDKYNNCFPDVNEQWFAVYVCYAKDKNWIQGYPDGEFKPANEVNKVEALKMIINSQGLNIPGAVNDHLFDDVDNSSWYAPFVKSAKDNGLLDVTGTIYGVGESITRAEVSENIYRTILVNLLSGSTTSGPDSSTEEQTPEDILAEIDGYAVFASESFKFSIEYPEAWYYQGLPTDENGMRPYEFGPGLADEEPAVITLLIGTGQEPEGTIVEMNGKSLIVVEEGSEINIYYTGESTGRLFHLSGMSEFEDVMLNMGSSIIDEEPEQQSAT
ncbi:MAG: S-layer homology domain-containing protein [Candidatus Gracilibacteria bacterium]